MNIAEANKTSQLLRWITGTRTGTDEARAAAVWLADRVQKALSAGVRASEIETSWPEVDPARAASDRQVFEAAVNAWEDGHVDPHDVLTLIRDQLRGTPITTDPADIREGRWPL